MRKFSWILGFLVGCLTWSAQAATEADMEYAAAEQAYRAGNYSAAYLKLLPLAQDNYASAQFLLGRMSDNGFGSVQLNPSEAFRWYQKAAQQGNGPALFAVAKAHAAGRGTPADSKQAIAWLTKAADASYVPALLTISSLYQDGRGVEKNPARAAEWERRAAELGYLEAEYRTGERLLAGDGVPANPKLAAEWFKRAADKGHPGAFYRLAHISTLSTAKSAKSQPNKVQNFVWLSLASQRANDEVKREARQELAALQTDMTPEELADAQEQLRDWKPSANVEQFIAPGDEEVEPNASAAAAKGGKPPAPAGRGAPAKAAGR